LYDLFNFDFVHAPAGTRRVIDVLVYLAQCRRRWLPTASEREVRLFFAAYLVDHALRRLTNSLLDRDAAGASALDGIGQVLDAQATWLAPASQKVDDVQLTAP
jgi:hypothetical protein